MLAISADQLMPSKLLIGANLMVLLSSQGDVMLCTTLLLLRFCSISNGFCGFQISMYVNVYSLDSQHLNTASYAIVHTGWSSPN